MFSQAHQLSILKVPDFSVVGSNNETFYRTLGIFQIWHLKMTWQNQLKKYNPKTFLKSFGYESDIYSRLRPTTKQQKKKKKKCWVRNKVKDGNPRPEYSLRDFNMPGLQSGRISAVLNQVPCTAWWSWSVLGVSGPELIAEASLADKDIVGQPKDLR